MSHDHEGSCECGGQEQTFEDLKQIALQPDGTYKISGEMVIGDLVAAFPQAAPIMLSHGLHCVGCHANAFDTVEEGARGHGMPDEEIMEMIEEINVAVNHKIETIEVTEKAVIKVKELRALEKGKETWPLRVAVTPGGCAGFGYDMDFDEKKEHDITLTFDDLEVIIDPESMTMLKGSKIDFVDSLRGSGFKVENPNAKRGCGCGKSFG
jgi:iron-sulfur cluster assembly protein